MQSQLDDWKLKMARMKAEHDRQDAERAEAERELRAKADAEAYLNSPEKRQEEFQQRALAAMPVSFGIEIGTMVRGWRHPLLAVSQ
jgi:hypothetical protein